MMTSMHFPREVIQIDLQTLLISHKDTALGAWHYMRHTPTRASESKELAILSIRLLTHLEASAETVLPYHALLKQKGEETIR